MEKSSSQSMSLVVALGLKGAEFELVKRKSFILQKPGSLRGLSCLLWRNYFSGWMLGTMQNPKGALVCGIFKGLCKALSDRPQPPEFEHGEETGPQQG